MDVLQIKSLKIKTRIGVYAWEQKIHQILLIDLDLFTNLKNTKDRLINTIDYDKLCQKITTFASNNSFNLIETVANEIASLIKKEFDIKKFNITVSKPHAVKNAENISVSITN